MWHEVEPGHTRSTLQLGEPSVIAERLGVTTVADFRPRDIAAGGQGAPLASWGDALLFGDEQLSRAVQNIGGIGNVTWVPPGGQWEAMLAFDTGPGNALMDHAAWRLSGGMQRFDADGALAASGRVDDSLLAELLDHPYFPTAAAQEHRPRALRRPAGRSVHRPLPRARAERPPTFWPR